MVQEKTPAAQVGTPSPNSYNQGQYKEMLKNAGTIAGEGIQGLATIASMGGDSMSMQQGHDELAPSYRKPLTVGKNSTLDTLGGAKYINDAK